MYFDQHSGAALPSSGQNSIRYNEKKMGISLILYLFNWNLIEIKGEKEKTCS